MFVKEKKPMVKLERERGAEPALVILLKTSVVFKL